MKRVRPERCASVIEAGIENVFAVCSRRATIVNNKRKDDRARSRFSARNVFAPEPAPGSVATEAIAGAAAVAAAMSGARQPDRRNDRLPHDTFPATMRAVVPDEWCEGSARPL